MTYFRSMALASCLVFYSTIFAADSPNEVPKEVKAIEGNYSGEWALFGIDESGESVKKLAWTDTMKVTGAEVKGDRAQVHAVSEMKYDGGKIPPRKYEGKEGYYLKPGGGLGDYFIESFGQVTKMKSLGDGVWTYTAAAAEQELTSLGFPKGAKGRHVLVKVVTNEKDIETHRISRVTTVQWKDKDGKDRVTQYVSLKGFHKRDK
ncbi:MAG: hypothetical protein U0798_04535 [Gemmataceae bacterium]